MIVGGTTSSEVGHDLMKTFQLLNPPCQMDFEIDFIAIDSWENEVKLV